MGARFVAANGLRFAYLEDGPERGPLALCLHGFPDHAPTFRHLLPQLAAAGFHAVAPWLRGYAPSAVPEDGDVSLDTLAADANALHEALGGDARAVIVGHDWGALAAHRAGTAAPQRWRRVVTIAVPPESHLVRMHLTLAQVRRSHYAVRMQAPGAVAWLRANDFQAIDALWGAWSPSYRRPAEDRFALRATLRSPGTLETAVGYYRQVRRDATIGRFPRPDALPPQPHLYLHGLADGCVGGEIAQGVRLAHPKSRVELIPGAGHFLHLEHPVVIGETITAFLTES